MTAADDNSKMTFINTMQFYVGSPKIVFIEN